MKEDRRGKEEKRCNAHREALRMTVYLCDRGIDIDSWGREIGKDADLASGAEFLKYSCEVRATSVLCPALRFTQDAVNPCVAV